MSSILDIYPLSPLQQGMLFHSVSDGVPGVYCEQVVGEVCGGLDPARFRAALDHVVARHDSLRTAFVWEDVDAPLQLVHDRVIVPHRCHDWTACDAAARRRRLDGLLEEERRRGFDLDRAPLLRVDLAGHDHGHTFVLTFHHAVLDGWSLSIVLRELIAAYEGGDAGRDAESPRPFKDYVAWLLTQTVDEEFWRQELCGVAAPTPIVESLGGRVDPAGAGTHAEEAIWLDEEMTAALQSAARSCRVTLNTFVQGAWALLLSRLASTDEVVFGALVSGRPAQLESVEAMCGVFINTLPVRARPAADLGVGEFLRELQTRNGRLREHEHTPLARIQAAADLPRGQALFESVLVFENYPAEIESFIREATGGTWDVTVRSLQLTNYPLHLMVVPGGRLHLDLTYDRRAVAPAAAARLMDGLRTVLGAMAATPEARLGAIALLAPAAREPVFAAGRGAVRPRPDVGFSALFLAQAQRTPEAMAARDGQRVWTYRELAERTAHGAARLANAGAGPENVVALLGPRNLDFLAAMVSILGAGAAFLPLDRRQPPARQAELVRRSGARVIVADGAAAAPLLEELRRDGAAWPAFADLSSLSEPGTGTTVGERTCRGDRLAYVLFTSGSTGVPKGAMIEQRGLVNHLLAKVEELPIGAGDVVAQTAPACFDIAIWQFLAPLVSGAATHIIPDDIAFDGTRLLEAVDRASVTVLETVPSLLRAMVDDLERRGPAAPRLARLRVLLATGEGLSVSLCRSWLSRCPHVPIVNAYGPTECADDVTHHRIALPPTGNGLVPIGHALANTRLYVLDSCRQPLPAGCIGELAVAGDGVGRGYLGDEARTAEAFAGNPFAADPAARVYYTGDRARLDPESGLFEFLGRRDDQVKVRGHRIEMGEIEARLSAHPLLSASAVVAPATPGGDRRLVAFLTLRAPVEDAALRAFLGQTLPDYMQPAFVRRDALPLTANGKVDRRALERDAPELATASTTAGGAPRDETEATLARIWAEVLQREDVGIDQNFFALGGDSILIMQVVSRMRQAGHVVTVRQIFEHQTVAGVARAMRGAPSSRPTVAPAVGPLPLAPIQAWFFELDVPTRRHWNMSLRLATRGPLRIDTLREALRAVAAHHAALRARFTEQAGVWTAEIPSGAAPVHVESLDAAGLDGPAHRAWRDRAEKQLHAGLDLATGDLLRAALIDGGPDASEVLLVAHHLVVDAVSWRILVEDLEAAYLAIESGAAPTLAPTTPFREWTQRLREHVDADRARADWDHWLAEGQASRARLHVDHPERPNTEGAARMRELVFDPDATEALTRRLPATGLSTQDVLLAAVAEALGDLTTDGELVLNVEAHGRDDFGAGLDITRTVGWLTALHPLAVGPACRLGMTERVSYVRARRAAVPAGGITYGLLRHFGGDPSLVQALRALPLPEVSFNYFGRLDPSFDRSILFAGAREGTGPDRDPQAVRPHSLDVSAGVFGGRLRIIFIYAPAWLSDDAIGRFARGVQSALEAAIAVAVSPEPEMRTEVWEI